jgi:hypothetical protein
MRLTRLLLSTLALVALAVDGLREQERVIQPVELLLDGLDAPLRACRTCA